MISNKTNKKGMEQSFFIIVAAILALVILVVMLIISNKGIGGPFEKIFAIGQEAGSRSDFCQDVNAPELCDRYSELKCSEASAYQYGCMPKPQRGDTNTYICIGRRECGSGSNCCKSAAAG